MTVLTWTGKRHPCPADCRSGAVDCMVRIVGGCRALEDVVEVVIEFRLSVTRTIHATSILHAWGGKSWMSVDRSSVARMEVDEMEFSLEAKTMLGILHRLARKKIRATHETIRAHDEWAQQGKDDQSLNRALDQLIEGALVSPTGNTYSLTTQGFAQAKQFLSEEFNTLMVACEQSLTNRKLCQQVYGLDLCQFNMMSQVQLDKLLEVMNLCQADHILDLGCGVGLVSEYISDVTGARMLGIDFASAAIQRAQARTREKSERLTYQVMDMDELSLPAKSFSGVISIDTLYFVNDLPRTIRSVQACLHENGQMGFFYSTKIAAGQTDESLAPDQTPLAKVLQEHGLSFQTWDFTHDERDIWEKILQVAEALKPAFEAEGHLDIYEANVSEARSLLEYVTSDVK